MLNLNHLLEFSQTHCIAICSVLVPANLIATLQTMLLAGFRRPSAQVYVMASVASCYAMLLISHVVAWLAIGVIMIPTYVLTILGCVCLAINLGAVVWVRQRQQGSSTLYSVISSAIGQARFGQTLK